MVFMVVLPVAVAGDSAVVLMVNGVDPAVCPDPDIPRNFSSREET